ncbi:hypothetical protein LPJ56_001179 [Coemansia sp. RSA 2599]|nr:hypothetical protein LPJ75_000777 [Coemansia sp. RSA 2598]KAJ1828320.1 hypothetical protein LPJ56_001179 [Coemansia sp. RSA 2599]
MPDGTSRCDNCIRDNIPCVWRESKRRGPKRKNTGSGGVQIAQRSVASISNLLNESENPGIRRPTDTTDTNGQGVGPLSSLTPAMLKDAGGSQTKRPATMAVPRSDNLVAEFYSSKVPADIRQSVLSYFTYLYAICPVLHPSTLLRKAVGGTLDPLLVDVLHATASRFSLSADARANADIERVFTRATQMLLDIQQQPSVDTVCALQILDIAMTGKRGLRKYDVFKTSLTTLIHQLGWHELDQHENLVAVDTWDDWIERETKRRVFWVNHKIDSQQSAIFSRRPLLEDTRIHVRKPCPDSEWDELSTRVLLANIGETDTEAEQLRAIHTIQNSLTQTFSLGCPTEAYLSRLGVFYNDAKKNWLRQRNDNRRWTQNADAASPLGDSLLFKKFDSELRQWRANMVVAEKLKDPQVDAENIQFFGSPRHRVFLARTRYFCINIYSYAITIFLHLSNRPSFLPESEPPGDGSRDKSLKDRLLCHLGSSWALGLVSQDVDPASWKKCLAACHDLSRSIVANSDVPVCFVDMVVPACLFLSISVLLRQIRLLDPAKSPAEADAVAEDLRIQWNFFDQLGSLWNTSTLLSLLRHLGIDQALASDTHKK